MTTSFLPDSYQTLLNLYEKNVLTSKETYLPAYRHLLFVSERMKYFSPRGYGLEPADIQRWVNFILGALCVFDFPNTHGFNPEDANLSGVKNILLLGTSTLKSGITAAEIPPHTLLPYVPQSEPSANVIGEYLDELREKQNAPLEEENSGMMLLGLLQGVMWALGWMTWEQCLEMGKPLPLFEQQAA